MLRLRKIEKPSLSPAERPLLLNTKTLRSLLAKARSFLAAAKVDVTYASLQTALLYLVVEQARAAQKASNSGPALLQPLDGETPAETLPSEQVIADLDTEKQSDQAAAAQTDHPLSPTQAADFLRTLIEEELQISGPARGLGAERVIAQDESATPLPQSSIQKAEPATPEGTVEGTVQTGLPTPEVPVVKAESGSSPFALLGGVLLGGIGGGGAAAAVAGIAGAAGAAGFTASLYSLGIVADGYISGATVKLYGLVNGHEQVIATTTTNALGQYQFEKQLLAVATKIVASGGTDVSTGLKFNVELTAPSSATVVNPLTTLIQSYIEKNPGLDLTAEMAMNAVKTALGITGAMNLLTVDPIALASGSTGAALAEALALQGKAAQIANLLVTGSLAVAGVKGVSGEEAYAGILTKLVDAIGSLGPGALDLASSQVLGNLLSTGGAQSVSSQVLDLLANGNAMASASSLAAIYEYQKVVRVWRDLQLLRLF